MLKLATTLLPLLLSGRTSDVKRNIGLLLLAYCALAFAGLLLLAALFVFAQTRFGLMEAFLIVGAVLLLTGLIALAMAKRNPPNRKAVEKAEAAQSLVGDPIAEFIPDDMLANPAVVSALARVRENPLTTTIVALGIGIALSQSLGPKR